MSYPYRCPEDHLSNPADPEGPPICPVLIDHGRRAMAVIEGIAEDKCRQHLQGQRVPVLDHWRISGARLISKHL